MGTPLTWDTPNLRWDTPGLTWDGMVPDPQPTHRTMDNMISATLSAADKAAILTKINEIKALLPFLINLTVEEKSSLPKMSTFRDGMDAAFAAEMAAHPELVPSFVDTAELAKDRTLRSDLRDIYAELNPLTEGVDDTMTATGVDTYLGYLSTYNNVKQAAKRNVPGANSMNDNLKRFFPRGRRSSAPTNPITPLTIPRETRKRCTISSRVPSPWSYALTMR